jgi:hypothetical protein
MADSHQQHEIVMQAAQSVFCNVYFAMVLIIEMCVSEHHILMVRYMYLEDKLCLL